MRYLRADVNSRASVTSRYSPVNGSAARQGHRGGDGGQQTAVLAKRLFSGNMVCVPVILLLEFNVIMGLQPCASKAGDIYYTDGTEKQFTESLKYELTGGFLLVARQKGRSFRFAESG